MPKKENAEIDIDKIIRQEADLVVTTLMSIMRGGTPSIESFTRIGQVLGVSTATRIGHVSGRWGETTEDYKNNIEKLRAICYDAITEHEENIWTEVKKPARISKENWFKRWYLMRDHFLEGTNRVLRQGCIEPVSNRLIKNNEPEL